MIRTDSSARVHANEKGIIVIEAVIVMILWMSSISLLTTLAYTGFARIWLGHWLYESTLCATSSESPRYCEKLLRQRGVSLLPIGHLNTIRLSRTQSFATGQLEFNLGNFHQIQLKSKIHLDKTTMARSQTN